MQKTLVILPTYKEKDTLPVILVKVLSLETFDILIIDDNSPDGTADLAEHWSRQYGRISVIKRPRKMGLGTAYLTGFRWGLEKGYDCMVEMDSDLSHNPLDLTKFQDAIMSGADLVVGSRYMNGTISVVGWDFKRLLLSKMGNLYASKLLGLQVADLTSGFRAYSRRALERMDLDEVRSEGYAFQIEMAYLVARNGFRIKEIPIIFTERLTGTSKMSKEIVREAVWIPFRLRWNELKNFIMGPFARKKKALAEKTDEKKALTENTLSKTLDNKTLNKEA
jgi:dolichol-phosphate mannosyltransferase